MALDLLLELNDNRGGGDYWSDLFSKCVLELNVNIQ